MDQTGHKNKEAALLISWAYLARILIKALALFALCNLIFALVMPLEFLGSLSLYNWLLPGRERLPYGENAADAYNLSQNNLPALFASHKVSQFKGSDEFRVFILGDSGAWGWLLENEDSLAGQINAENYQTADGRRVVAYNLGYPIMSLTKDLMILDEARQYDPDLVVWPVTLHSFPLEQQLIPPLVQNNPERVKGLIEAHNLNLDPTNANLIEPDFLGRTLVGQRRALADLLRLQLYGFSWAATRVDQTIPTEFPLRKSDFEEDRSWRVFEVPTSLTEEDLATDVLAAGIAIADDVPILIVNQPMFISVGRTSELRYNAWYPRWAYDSYRALLQETAAVSEWQYLDLWDKIDSDEFTDSPVHLTPAGTKLLADEIVAAVLKLSEVN
jgi:lysophospholipase L1-like esterase